MLLGQGVKTASVAGDALFVDLGLDVGIAPLVGQHIGVQNSAVSRMT